MKKDRRNSLLISVLACIIGLYYLFCHYLFVQSPHQGTYDDMPSIQAQQAGNLSSVQQTQRKVAAHLNQPSPAQLNRTLPAAPVNNNTVARKCNLSGEVSFQRLEFHESRTGIHTDYELRPFYPAVYPSRNIRVNLRRRDGELIGKQITKETGEYSFELSSCNPSEQLYIELVANMYVKGIDPEHSMKVTVKSHSFEPTKTNKSSVYSVNSAYFTLPYDENQQNMLLETGFNQIDGFNEQRSHSQAFAILDSLAKGFDMLKEHGVDLPSNAQTLQVVWTRGIQPKVAAGGYYDAANNLIFIKGSTPVDTQSRPKTTNSEWNEHTILHELGHWYMEKVIGRSDSYGGAHSGYGFSELTLALDEGMAGAISRVALNDWQDKRAHSNITATKNVVSFDAMINKQVTNYFRYFEDSNGYSYHRPVSEFSPFDEVSNMLFFLSIIDERAQFSEQALVLAREIGFKGIHQSLLKAAKGYEPLTLYSVAAQLIEDNPVFAGEIEALGDELNVALSSQSRCGEQQWPLAAHMVGDGKLLAPRTQFPICSDLSLGEPLELSFNGALQSLASARPGTVRYAYFSVPYDAKVLIAATDAIDSLDKIHRFRFDVSLKGQYLLSSRTSKRNNRQFGYLSAIAGEVYVIRIVDASFDDPDYKSEESLSTNVSAQLY